MDIVDLTGDSPDTESESDEDLPPAFLGNVESENQ